MEVKCDNLDAVKFAKHPKHHDRTKHVETDSHFIKEKVERITIKLRHTPIFKQLTSELKLYLQSDLRSKLPSWE